MQLVTISTIIQINNFRIKNQTIIACVLMHDCLLVIGYAMNGHFGVYLE